MSKRALLIGINYISSAANVLGGCWNDVACMGEYLKNKGFVNTTLTDEPKNKDTVSYPTKDNILAAIDHIIAETKAGDICFFHFSGHGGQLPDRNADESDGLDECIFSCKLEVIIDDELRAHLVDKLVDGAILRCVLDCCHSGTGMDLTFRFTPDSGLVRENKINTSKNVIAVSGCLDNQTSADAYINKKYQGALTYHLLEALKFQMTGWSYKDFIKVLQYSLHKNGYPQVPQLSTTLQGIGKLKLDM